MDIAVSIVAAVISLLGAGVLSSDMVQKVLRALLGKKEPEKPYSERLSELTESPSKASREVDAVLIELARVSKDRAQAVQQLEADLAILEGREHQGAGWPVQYKSCYCSLVS
ncbi:MAG: hypothetical protein WB822_18010 [Rhodoplanes sp.]